MTGIGAMLAETVHDVFISMVKSYSFAQIVIAGLMVLMIGRLRLGLISVLPNLLPILLVPGIMGWMGPTSGLAIMLFAYLRSTHHLALITACSVVFALLADFFPVPVLMMVFYHKQAPSVAVDAQ